MKKLVPALIATILLLGACTLALIQRNARGQRELAELRASSSRPRPIPRETTVTIRHRDTPKGNHVCAPCEHPAPESREQASLFQDQLPVSATDSAIQTGITREEARVIFASVRYAASSHPIGGLIELTDDQEVRLTAIHREFQSRLDAEEMTKLKTGNPTLWEWNRGRLSDEYDASVRAELHGNQLAEYDEYRRTGILQDFGR